MMPNGNIAGGGSPSPQDAFVKHLEQASATVQTWPAWKQKVLGGVAPGLNPTASRSPTSAPRTTGTPLGQST
jgi:hypothetical protein